MKDEIERPTPPAGLPGTPPTLIGCRRRQSSARQGQSSARRPRRAISAALESDPARRGAAFLWSVTKVGRPRLSPAIRGRLTRDGRRADRDGGAVRTPPTRVHCFPRQRPMNRNSQFAERPGPSAADPATRSTSDQSGQYRHRSGHFSPWRGGARPPVGRARRQQPFVDAAGAPSVTARRHFVVYRAIY